MIKMTNENTNVQAETQEAAPKKQRRAFPKHQTSAAEIIIRLDTLTKEVKELEDAQHHVGDNQKLKAIVGKELMSKRKELEDAKNEVYYF